MNTSVTGSVFNKWLRRRASILWQGEKPRSGVGVSGLGSKGAWPGHIQGPVGLGDQRVQKEDTV